MAPQGAIEKIRQIWESEALEGSALRHWYINVEEAVEDFEKRGFTSVEDFVRYVMREIENTPDLEDWEAIAESLYD
jgi:hypothetical protein